MRKSGFKKGAASFYIVAFAALILVIIASSFVMVVISEVNRASNSDLSRSAYDSAMAGVEDAKLALRNYQKCLEQGYSGEGFISGGDDVTCDDILYYMNHPDCDMVAHILGRLRKDESGEVEISEGAGSSNSMNQAYTCVIIKTELSDYKADLDSSGSYKIIKVNLQDPSQINNINAVRLSWRSVSSDSPRYSNFLVSLFDQPQRVVFGRFDESSLSTPPTLALQLVQTAKEFSLSDVIKSSITDSETDRATLYLVPTNSDAAAAGSTGSNYIGTYSAEDDRNYITESQVVSTNNLEKNLPYVVHCGNDGLCQVVIEIPKPIGGDRSADTFMFAVSLPYGKPETEFTLELCIESSCESVASDQVAGAGETGTVSLSSMQVLIDSTGRANDLYRRVEVRMEGADSGATYFPYAIQATDDGGGDAAIEKKLVVNSDYGL